jgi:glucuronoarabinoxylan endo-1,4-beta-xylanase
MIPSKKLTVALSLSLLIGSAGSVWAQDVTVDLNDQKQLIQGYGGINHPVWAGDLTAAQRETAFGNGPNQLGFTVLRIFLSDNRNDWQREVATAQRAQELGALIFASPWNPPASMATTINGQKHVNPASYGEYATHLTDFYNFMQDNGVDLYSVSIQNEPDYANEWTWWSADEIVTFLKDYGGTFPFRVMAPESFQYRKQMSDPILNDPEALSNMDILGAHTYGTQVRDMPYPLFKEKGAGKELWMTEVYVPNSNADSADRWPEALDVALHVHNCMVEAEFQAYVWWYIRRSYGPMKEDGTISKRGYCMAHFSKFVRRGFVRVDATKSPKSDVYVSAYKGDSEVVAVIVNRSTSSQSLSFSIPGTDITSYERYTTSSSKNLSDDGTVDASSGAFTVTLDAQSVTTLHGTGEVPGTVGVGGAGGAPGTGGAPAAGGTQDTGGAASTGGTPGMGGTPAAGGTPGSGGFPSTGGTPATGAAAGTGGRPGSGGTPGGGGSLGASGGSRATGGVTTGSGGVGPAGLGGQSTPSTGGAEPGASGGTTTDPTLGAVQNPAADGDAGCGCRSAGGGRRASIPAAAALFGLLGLARRRRRRAAARA